MYSMWYHNAIAEMLEWYTVQSQKLVGFTPMRVRLPLSAQRHIPQNHTLFVPLYCLSLFQYP